MYMNLPYLKQLLNNVPYTLVASREQFLYLSHARGIAPILDQLYNNKLYFKDCIVVDQVIGKASAMMLARSHASYVYGNVMSVAAEEVLKQYQIPYAYDTLVCYIMNRNQNGMCPMEQTVKDLSDLEEAYAALSHKLTQLRQGK